MTVVRELVHNIFHQLLIAGDGGSGKLVYHRREVSLKVFDSSSHFR